MECGPLVEAGVYAIVGRMLYPLSLSILLDNCSAMHLVNYEDLLWLGIFQLCLVESYIEAGSLLF